MHILPLHSAKKCCIVFFRLKNKEHFMKGKGIFYERKSYFSVLRWS